MAKRRPKQLATRRPSNPPDGWGLDVDAWRQAEADVAGQGSVVREERPDGIHVIWDRDRRDDPYEPAGVICARTRLPDRVRTWVPVVPGVVGALLWVLTGLWWTFAVPLVVFFALLGAWLLLPVRAVVLEDGSEATELRRLVIEHGQAATADRAPLRREIRRRLPRAPRELR